MSAQHDNLSATAEVVWGGGAHLGRRTLNRVAHQQFRPTLQAFPIPLGLLLTMLMHYDETTTTFLDGTVIVIGHKVVGGHIRRWFREDGESGYQKNTKG